MMKSFAMLCVGTLLLTGCVMPEHHDVVQEHAGGIGGMQIIGQAEYVTVMPSNYTYRARIDSGATTCSMSALDIENFERDGKKWVRFKLPLPSENSDGKVVKSDPMEYPVSRVANIKRHGADDQARPAVMMKVKLGQFEGLVEFTLTDRTKYEFPVLIGRNLLEGHAVVDVSQSYIAEEN